MDEPKFRKKHEAKNKKKEKGTVYSTKSVRITLNIKERVFHNGRNHKENGTVQSSKP